MVQHMEANNLTEVVMEAQEEAMVIITSNLAINNLNNMDFEVLSKTAMEDHHNNLAEVITLTQFLLAT
jgi:methyltransferase-like protein